MTGELGWGLDALGEWGLWGDWELLGNLGDWDGDWVHWTVTGRTGGYWGTGMGTGCTGM